MKFIKQEERITRNAIQFPCRLKEGKKRKVNEKINEIRKHKLPIISLKKVKLVGASRVIVCVQVYAIHFESDEKKFQCYSVGTQVSSLVLADLYLHSGWSISRYLKRSS